MDTLLSSLRVALATSAICVIGYGALILAIGQAVTPHTANASILRTDDRRVIGSSQVAQSFTQPRYFWSRPSAVDYDGVGAGGSNLAPTNPALAERARPALAALGASAENPVPADLVTASGSGLDPHISIEGALYQAPRVAQVRGLELSQVEALVREAAFSPGGFLTEGKIVNALELNLALDQLSKEGAVR